MTAKSTPTAKKHAKPAPRKTGGPNKPPATPAAKRKVARPAAAAPKKVDGRRKNPLGKHYVIVGPEGGFKTQEDALAYAQRFANTHKVAVHVVQK